MAKPLIVEIPHEIGPVEAKRRISNGLDKAKAACAKAGINVEHMTWTDDRLNFAMSAMGQKLDGEVDVLPETVRIEVRLPMLLALFAERMKKIIGKEGNQLLIKKG